MGARHVRRSPGFIDEDELGGIEVHLIIEPALALLQEIGAVLLYRVASPLLRVCPCRMALPNIIPRKATTVSQGRMICIQTRDLADNINRSLGRRYVTMCEKANSIPIKGVRGE